MALFMCYIHPHSRPTVDPEEGSTPKAEMPDEGTTVSVKANGEGEFRGIPGTVGNSGDSVLESEPLPYPVP